MNLALIKKYVHESAILFIGLLIGVFTFCLFRVRVVGKLDTSQFQQIMDLLPKDWRKFAAVDFDWLVSYLGRTSFTLDEPMLVLLISAWAIVRGSDVVSGELSRGTMEMFLAQPISRRRVFVMHAFLTVVGLLILVLVAWWAMAVGVWTTSVDESRYPEIFGVPMTFAEPIKTKVAMGSQVGPLMFLPGIINFFALGFFLAAASAMVSAWDSFRWRTIGIMSAFYFVNAGIKIFGMSLDENRWITHLSIFGFYSPANAIALTQDHWTFQWHLFQYDASGAILQSGPLLNNLVLIVLGAVAYWIGCRRFEKRDLPAPM